jgi:hypothetical protein
MFKMHLKIMIINIVNIAINLFYRYPEYLKWWYYILSVKIHWFKMNVGQNAGKAWAVCITETYNPNKSDT